MRVTLVKTVSNTADIKTFWFTTKSTLSYQAGQFVDMTLPKSSQRHTFTLSSSPTESQIAITTKFHDSVGPFKKELLAMKPGEQATISSPLGDYVLPRDSKRPLIFVVGGIGVTPLRSIIKYLGDTTDARNITTLYSATKLSDMAFLKELQAYDMKLQLFETKSKSPSRITINDVMQQLKPAPDSLIYISGPQGFVEQLFEQLLAKNIPRSQIIIDYFPGYLDD